MYATYIVKRTQIYLDEEQDRRLSERAKADGVTKSHLIRKAVEAYLDDSSENDEEREKREFQEFLDAADKAFGIAPYLPDGKTYVEDLRRRGAARQEDLDRHWRGDA